jgi:GNAT superfamily N-acetyltransferase
MPIREISLRECREDDRAFVWEVRRQALREYVAATWGWDEAAQRSRFEGGFTPAGHQIIVCEGIDVGLLQVVDEGDHLFVGKIELLPTSQRKGVGSAILRRILEKGRERGIPVRLQALRANAPARRLYERLGFAVTGETDTHTRMEWSPATSTA